MGAVRIIYAVAGKHYPFYADAKQAAMDALKARGEHAFMFGEDELGNTILIGDDFGRTEPIIELRRPI